MKPEGETLWVCPKRRARPGRAPTAQPPCRKPMPAGQPTLEPNIWRDMSIQGPRRWLDFSKAYADGRCFQHLAHGEALPYAGKSLIHPGGLHPPFRNDARNGPGPRWADPPGAADTGCGSAPIVFRSPYRGLALLTGTNHDHRHHAVSITKTRSASRTGIIGTTSFPDTGARAPPRRSAQALFPAYRSARSCRP
jgi:hypothetical protein